MLCEVLDEAVDPCDRIEFACVSFEHPWKVQKLCNDTKGSLQCPSKDVTGNPKNSYQRKLFKLSIKLQSFLQLSEDNSHTFSFLIINFLRFLIL